MHQHDIDTLRVAYKIMLDSCHIHAFSGYMNNFWNFKYIKVDIGSLTKKSHTHIQLH